MGGPSQNRLLVTPGGINFVVFFFVCLFVCSIFVVINSIPWRCGTLLTLSLYFTERSLVSFFCKRKQVIKIMSIPLKSERDSFGHFLRAQ